MKQQNNTLGRLQGLIEAWGKNGNGWTPEQKRRLVELYRILEPEFVIGIFTGGLKSDEMFLTHLTGELFGTDNG